MLVETVGSSPYRSSTPCGDFASCTRKICSQGLRIPHAVLPALLVPQMCGAHLRRRWDSNPRGCFHPASLAVRYFRPLSHVSVPDRVANLVREGEGNDRCRTCRPECFNCALEGSSRRKDVVNNYIGTSRVEGVRGFESSTHIFLAGFSGKRDL